MGEGRGSSLKSRIGDYNPALLFFPYNQFIFKILSKIILLKYSYNPKLFSINYILNSLNIIPLIKLLDFFQQQYIMSLCFFQQKIFRNTYVALLREGVNKYSYQLRQILLLVATNTLISCGHVRKRGGGQTPCPQLTKKFSS